MEITRRMRLSDCDRVSIGDVRYLDADDGNVIVGRATATITAIERGQHMSDQMHGWSGHEYTITETVTCIPRGAKRLFDHARQCAMCV